MLTADPRHVLLLIDLLACYMSNPSKQPRVDEHPDKEASDAGVIQDQAASFADGNIDIIAGNTSFRVHRGVLSVHSEVFRIC